MLKRVKPLLIIAAILASSVAFAGTVERAQFTTDIIDREPVDRIEVLDSNQHQIKYFTELKDLQGQIVTHQWIYDDNVVFEKTFEVGGPRWRVWSSKTLPSGLTGYWYVNTLDQERNSLLRQSFEYR